MYYIAMGHGYAFVEEICNSEIAPTSALLLCCSAALLLYSYAVCVVFIAANFTVALFFI